MTKISTESPAKVKELINNKFLNLTEQLSLSDNLLKIKSKFQKSKEDKIKTKPKML